MRIEAQMHGGGHERGTRSGTLPTHRIVGMGEAYRLARLEIDAVVESVTVTVARLREMSPLWDMHRYGVDFRTVQWAAH